MHVKVEGDKVTSKLSFGRNSQSSTGAGGGAPKESKSTKQARKEAKEREARVEHLARGAARRIQQQGLIKGWGSWCELWEEKRRQREAAEEAKRLAREQKAREGRRLEGGVARRPQPLAFVAP